jgi:hypothetical protein
MIVKVLLAITAAAAMCHRHITDAALSHSSFTLPNFISPLHRPPWLFPFSAAPQILGGAKEWSKGGEVKISMRRRCHRLQLKDADHGAQLGRQKRSGEEEEEMKEAATGRIKEEVNGRIRARMNQLHGEDAETVINEGLKAIMDVRAADLTLTTENFNVIIYVICRARNASPALLDRALATLKAEGLRPNTKTYNFLLSASKPRGAVALRGAGGSGGAAEDPLERTLEVLGMMDKDNVKPDDYSYTLVLAACSRLARRDGPRALRLARDYFEEMREAGIEPSTFTVHRLLKYSCI